MTDKKYLRCHVIAGAGSSLEPLLRVLYDSYFSVINAESLPPAGELTPGDLSNQLKKADVVVAVMQGEYDNVVMFELGVALGLGKTAFLVVVGAEVPFALESLPFLKVPSLKDPSLPFHLQQLHDRLSLGTTRGRRSSKGRAGSTPLIPDWVSVPSLPGSGGRDLERQIADALSMAGVISAISTASVSSRSKDAPDIVVWFKELPETLSNPIVVEVRRSMPPTESKVFEKLHKYSRAAGTKTALLIVDDSRFDRVKVVHSGSGYVFTLSPDVLFREIENGSLFSTLVHARNASAHMEER